MWGCSNRTGRAGTMVEFWSECVGDRMRWEQLKTSENFSKKVRNGCRGSVCCICWFFLSFEMKLVDALGVVGVISCCKAVCLDSRVESVNAVKHCCVSKSACRGRSMRPGVVGVRIALSITKMGQSWEGNQQEGGKGRSIVWCQDKVCLIR